MIPDRFLIQLYRSIALLALVAPCEVMAFQAVDEPAENKEEPQTTPEAAGFIPEDAALDAEGLLDQGEKSLLEGQYAKAGEYFARAASLNPNDPRSRLSLGFSEFALGDFENAATTVREVMKIAPDLAATPLDMRGLFGEVGIIEKQLANLEQITRLHSKSSRMQYLLGFVRYFSGDRALGAKTLLEYSAANPDDSTIRPFIEIAENVTKSMPQPDQRSIVLQPESETVEAPGPPLENRSPAPDERPRKYAATGQRHPHNLEPRFSGPPNSRGSATVVEPRRPSPEVVFASAPESDNLAEIAVSVFCREEGLDPFDNDVVARVTDEDFDEETGDVEAEIEMHWVEWEFEDGRRRAEPNNETIELRFDERGRLVEYDD